MPTFKWEVQGRDGKVQKGTMTAANEQAVTTRLKQQGIVNPTVTKMAGIEIRIPGFEPKIQKKSLIIFTRQFATMIDAGLPLVQGLEILAAQNDDAVMQKVLFDVKNDVESGSTFAAALEKHKSVFDDLYIALISAGELGGILDTILERLAQYIEKADQLKQKVKSAMTYPAIVAVVSICVVIGLMVYVIPTFASIFRDLGSDLPPITLFVMDTSDFFVDNIFLILLVIGAFYVVLKTVFKVQATRWWIDVLGLKLPVIGDTIRKIAVARFCRTMGTMISSGIPILQAMETVEKAAGNMVIEKAIQNVRDRVMEGKNMAEPLMATGIFPPMVVQMIAVGETTGSLDSMLGKIADFYDEEVDVAVDGLTSFLEPLVMVFLGGIVAVILLAMYMPIFTMGSHT